MRTARERVPRCLFHARDESPLLIHRLGCLTALPAVSTRAEHVKVSIRTDRLNRAAPPPLPSPATASGFTDTRKTRKQLVRFLRLRCLGGDDAFLLESIFRSEVWDFMNEPVSRTNEEEVNNLLVTRCARCMCSLSLFFSFMGPPAFLNNVGFYLSVASQRAFWGRIQMDRDGMVEQPRGERCRICVLCVKRERSCSKSAEPTIGTTIVGGRACM